jgi:hypothetical protein
MARPRLDPNGIYVCIESFASSDPELPACARGIRLRR